MATKTQLAQYCAEHFPVHTIHSGTTFMHVVIAVTISLLAGFGIGWYVKGRGLTGVSIDLNNAKTVVTTDAQKVETTVAAAV